MKDKGYLILQNGKTFEGESFGYSADAFGEAVFTTAMTGVSETLTDPSYCGQILVQTFPLAGNYGLIPEDFESGLPRLSAFVVRHKCDVPSNFRSELSLGDFLLQYKIPGLCEVDTRSITREIRSAGTMNAAVVSELPKDMGTFLRELAGMRLCGTVEKVTAPDGEQKSGDVVLIDFGCKSNMKRELEKRGFSVRVVNAHTTAEEIAAMAPKGILLSNGPGDPADNVLIIAEIKKLCGLGIPIMGICLGHQLLALANGGKTSKLKFGHRGANQPAANPETGRIYITSQNHGYAVDKESKPKSAKLLFLNANDGTVEGLYYEDIKAFSVQFHPEACAGPRDTSFLFDEFTRMIKEDSGYAALR